MDDHSEPVHRHQLASDPPIVGSEVDRIFAGGDEMGALMRATDWGSTPLGPPSNWPQSLRTSISIMLEARFPMVVAWGPEFRFFYNDRYRPILGKTKHPGALGTPGQVIFPEVWHAIGPEFNRVRRGESFAIEDWLLPLDRNGYLENCYFTLSYSPIRDESGDVGGLLAVVAETTGRVEGERRLATLRELARGMNDAKTPRDVCEVAAAIFGGNAIDVPFSLAYLFDGDERRARLVASSNIAPGSRAAPMEIDLSVENSAEDHWPLRAALSSHSMQILSDLPARFGSLPGGPYPEESHAAVVLPLTRSSGGATYGVLVLGVSPRRALDDRYQGFYELAAEHVVAGIASARAYDEERKRAEALAEVDRAKTTFFSNVSHEFRTPLTLMLGPLEDLLSGARGEVTPVARREIDAAHRNAVRLLKLVNALLDFARIEAGRVQAVYEALDLSLLTTQLASVFRSAVERSGLALVVDCPSLPEWVYVDRELWEKIVLNLLSNALKFTFSGEIGIRVRWKNEFVELEVRDTGIGIAANELPHLFKRFHRVQGARSRTHEGTGIGLALVQDLIGLHGGTITVESELGRGTAFIVTVRTGAAHLPPEQVGVSRTQASTAAHSDAYVDELSRWLPGEEAVGLDTASGHPIDGVATRSRPRVLVVDDNIDMRAYITRLLEHAYDVDAAVDGEDALAHIERHMPDLVLTDVMMPRMDGFALLAAVRANDHTRNLPIIVLSARAGEESTVEGLGAGADDYLVKPFAARELLARVQTHLELARVRAEAQSRVVAVLERENARMAATFEHAPAFIALLRGRTHVFESANPAYRDLVGNRELIGKSVHAAFPELAVQGYLDLLDGVFATGQPHIGSESRLMLQRDGHSEPDERFVNFVYQPLLDAAGEVSGILVHGIDVTDQVRARQQIDDLYHRVQEANASKTQFLAAMSHELRTPLNAILGYADLLTLGVRGPLAEAQRTDVERIRTASRYLLSLINDILNFIRVEAGQVDFHIAPVDVAELFSQSGELVVQPIRAKGLHFTVTPPSVTVTVLADPERAQQILLNLLTNAVKFTDRAGTVSLTCTIHDDAAHIHVRDSGRGIPKDQLSRIFEPFVQIDRAASRDAQMGVGLGLAISRDLARKMDGDLSVRSELGVGSEFTLVLPMGPMVPMVPT
ncbi:MAG: ATP-binding protein [bacterium]